MCFFLQTSSDIYWLSIYKCFFFETTNEKLKWNQITKKKNINRTILQNLLSQNSLHHLFRRFRKSIFKNQKIKTCSKFISNNNYNNKTTNKILWTNSDTFIYTIITRIKVNNRINQETNKTKQKYLQLKFFDEKIH